MTLKKQTHALGDELPDDSPLLADVNELLRLNHTLGEALADTREGWTYSAEDFVGRVQQRWPRSPSA